VVLAQATPTSGVFLLPVRLAAQVASIREFNASARSRTWLFAGVECDILPDGRLAAARRAAGRSAWPGPAARHDSALHIPALSLC
jgi:hypothetical protein